MRAVLARVLLALAVVLFQHGAVAHVLMHAGEETQHRHDGDHHPPHGCDACHAYVAAEGGEPPPAALSPVADGPCAPAVRVARTAPANAPDKPFDSQAPPACS